MAVDERATISHQVALPDGGQKEAGRKEVPARPLNTRSREKLELVLEIRRMFVPNCQLCVPLTHDTSSVPPTHLRHGRERERGE
jgi:hypothetical protein